MRMTRVVLRPNRPTVICEVFEDEVVAINLETGAYFGMSDIAREVWRLAESEMPLDDIIAHLAERYSKEPERIAADLASFTSSLLEHGLVVEAPADGSAPAARFTGPAGSWEAPKLAVYEDMKDLLLLDPIHDVDETGWPARKQDVVA
jgi:hypothetical protein